MKKAFYVLMLLMISMSKLVANDGMISNVEDQVVQGNMELSEYSSQLKFWEHEEPLSDRFMPRFISMITTLGLIIALIFFIVWFLKRFVTGRLEQSNKGNVIKILEKRMISQKTMIYLIEIENTGILIAESSNGVTRLSEFPLAAEEKTSS